MTTLHSNLDHARATARAAARRAGPFVEHFARFGYAAKGVVYCIVGALAAIAAFSAGGDATGSRGALATISRQPFGQILLGVVALGLAGYSLWQFIRAVEDPEGEGDDTKAIFKRIGIFISGVIHFGLVWYAIGVITGAATGGGDDQGAKSWSAWAMSYPLGQLIVAGVGIGIVGYGVQQISAAFRAKLDDQLRFREVQPQTRRWLVNISRFGIASRGVVFAMIGLFLVLAAWRHDPNQAAGLAGALRALEQQPYGPWLLGIVAVGLIAYGVYEFVRARYRQITPA